MTAVDNRTPEEQFALLLDGELSRDEVGDEIRSLYALAEAVEEHTLVPRAEFGFRAELRTTLAASAEDAPGGMWDRARDALWMRTANVRNSVRAAMASGVAASLIGTAGVAAASQQALPGQLLYPVKEVTESMRLALTGDLAASGRLHLAFADERLEEVADGAQDLRAQLLIETLDAMDEHSIDGAEDLLGYATRTGDDAVLSEITAFTEQQRTELRDVIRTLPSAVVPFAEESLEVLRRIDVEVAGDPEPCECDEPAPTAEQPDEPAISATDEPAGTPPRPCDCTPATDDPDAPAATREDPPVTPEPIENEPPAEQPPVEDEPVDLVPELPGPLDQVGDTLDDLVNEVLDESEPITDPLPVDPEDDVIDPIDETVDELLGDVPAPAPSPEPPAAPGLGS